MLMRDLLAVANLLVIKNSCCFSMRNDQHFYKEEALLMLMKWPIKVTKQYHSIC